MATALEPRREPSSPAAAGDADPPSVAPDTQAVADEQLPSRRCGRCRELFDGDLTLHPLAQASWWLCPPCREIPLDTRPHPAGAHADTPT